MCQESTVSVLPLPLWVGGRTHPVSSDQASGPRSRLLQGMSSSLSLGTEALRRQKAGFQEGPRPPPSADAQRGHCIRHPQLHSPLPLTVLGSGKYKVPE